MQISAGQSNYVQITCLAVSFVSAMDHRVLHALQVFCLLHLQQVVQHAQLISLSVKSAHSHTALCVIQGIYLKLQPHVYCNHMFLLPQSVVKPQTAQYATYYNLHTVFSVLIHSSKSLTAFACTDVVMEKSWESSNAMTTIPRTTTDAPHRVR